MTDITDTDYNKIVNAINEIYPDFMDKVLAKVKENDNGELLQQEQNLTDEIESTRLKMNTLRKQINAMEDSYNQYDRQLSGLEQKRTDIHKTWIAMNPAGGENNAELPKLRVNPPLERPDIRSAFEIVKKCLGVAYGRIDDLEYKRFDNLVNARNRVITMFGHDLNISDVTCMLHDAGEVILSNQILDFWMKRNGGRA